MSNAVVALRSAASRSSGPAWATWQMGWPVAGLDVTKVAPSAAARASPPMSSSAGDVGVVFVSDMVAECTGRTGCGNQAGP